MMKNILFTFVCLLSWTFSANSQTCSSAVALTPGTQQCDNTSNGIGDFFDNNGPCGSTSYDNGDDYIYVYTAIAADDGNILTVTLDGTESIWAGIFAYAGCPVALGGAADNCADSDATSSTGDEVSVTMTNGTSYYFHISTFATPQTTDFCVDAVISPPPPPVGCESSMDVAPICTDSPVMFAGGVNQTAAAVDNPNVNYGCLSTSPNPAWYYLEVETTGTLAFDISNSASNDIDWAAWGPFTDLAMLNSSCGAGSSPFNATVDCDYTTAGSGTINLGSVTAGQIYAVLVTNFSNTATDISMASTAGSTATTDCSIPECAATCADAAATSCNVYETAVDTPASSYGEIQTNGGEGCFLSPLDVSAVPAGDQSATVTRCFEYTHNIATSAEFYVLSGTSVIENNDVSTTTDCEAGIALIEIFDATCTSLVSGGQGTTYSSAVNGTTYTICVTGFANNGTAEGDCTFNCMAHSVTAVTTPVCDANYSYSAANVCSGSAPVFVEDSGACVEPGGSVVDPAVPHLDLDWYMYAPGGVPQAAPAGYDPVAGATSINTFPIPNTDLVGGADGLGGTWNGFVCADLTVGAALTVTNNTCTPITVTYFALAWDRLNDTDGDGDFGEYNSDCPNLRFDVIINPAAPTASVTDNTTCGMPSVQLLAADGATLCGAAATNFGTAAVAACATGTTTVNSTGSYTAAEVATIMGGDASCYAQIDYNGDSSCPNEAPIVANAGTNVNTTCTTAVALNATSGTGTWSGGLGAFSLATSPTSTYTPTMAEAGTTVTLTWTVAATTLCPETTDMVDVVVAACPACTLVLSAETVVCSAMTAGVDMYTVSIPFDNGVEGVPGAGNYTITTTGTISGDNPMTAATGTITLTYTEGTDYSYQIQGVAASGANETCDITVSGISPACSASCNADNGTWVVPGPLTGGNSNQ